MNDNEIINLTLDEKDKSMVGNFVKILDRTFKEGKKSNKNYTYRQTIIDSFHTLLSKEFKSKSRKELN
tara:strand:- start:1979 stop:2182 length:204 start_codon:yes stop_codon:yes gene_type:complete